VTAALGRLSTGAAMSLALLLASCSRQPAASGVLILVSLDTLRADRLGFHGYSAPTSPFLDSLAARSVAFDNAIVQLPGTLPSHMSMFTGLYPWEHGVLPPDGVLAEDIPTVTEVLRAAGFRTAAFTEGYYVSAHYGFGRGFESFVTEEPVMKVGARYRKVPDGSHRVFDRALEQLRRLGPSEAAFVFVHTYAAHDPYDPPAAQRARFWRGAPLQEEPPTGEDLNRHNQGRRVVSPALAEYYSALYDAQIADLDSVLRRFFGGLEALGRSDVTVIVTSDHGEEFLEHGKLGHEQIYQQTLHVPLLLVGAGRAGARVPCLVQSVDLAATLFDLARIPQRARPRTSGRSLLPFAEGRPCPARQEAFATAAESGTFSIHERGVDGYWQYVISEPPDTWIVRHGQLQAAPPQIAFKAIAFEEERQVRLRLDGRDHSSFRVTPTGLEVRVPLPAGTPRHTIDLEADGCVSPAEAGLGEDPRCLSFRLEGVSLQRRELLSLAPGGAASDVSLAHPDVEARLERRLERLRGVELRSRQRVPLSPEQQERLRALGYLE